MKDERDHSEIDDHEGDTLARVVLQDDGPGVKPLPKAHCLPAVGREGAHPHARRRGDVSSTKSGEESTRHGGGGRSGGRWRHGLGQHYLLNGCAPIEAQHSYEAQHRHHPRGSGPRAVEFFAAYKSRHNSLSGRQRGRVNRSPRPHHHRVGSLGPSITTPIILVSGSRPRTQWASIVSETMKGPAATGRSVVRSEMSRCVKPRSAKL